ncbi:flavodoxin domain-containing protein [Sphingomonas sp. MMS24-JH45]
MLLRSFADQRPAFVQAADQGDAVDQARRFLDAHPPAPAPRAAERARAPRRRRTRRWARSLIGAAVRGPLRLLARHRARHQEEIAERARVDGFDVVVRSMDESFKGGAAPQDKVVILVTATYNGRAPDSAVAVERALDAGLFDDADWSGARVAVLGIGNSQWPNYQVFPKRVAAAVEKAGATIPAVPRRGGQGRAISTARSPPSSAPVEGARRGQRTRRRDRIAEPRPHPCRRYPRPRAARTRAAAGDRRQRRTRPPADGLWDFAKEPPRPSTRLIRIRLPEGQVYHTGDHIAVYARNRPDLVDRALSLLGVAPDAQVRVDASGGRFRHLPLGQTVTVRQLLTDFVELSDAASRRAVAQLGLTTRCPHTRERLAALEGDYDAAVAGKRLTLTDLLEAHPAAELSLDAFVNLFPAIAPRFCLDRVLAARLARRRRPHRRHDGRAGMVRPRRASRLRLVLHAGGRRRSASDVRRPTRPSRRPPTRACR